MDANGGKGILQLVHYSNAFHPVHEILKLQVLFTDGQENTCLDQMRVHCFCNGGGLERVKGRGKRGDKLGKKGLEKERRNCCLLAMQNPQLS